MLIALFAIALIPLAFAQDTDIPTVMAALQNGNITPAVVPNFTPAFPLDVVFTDNTGSTFAVTAGANLTIAQTANIPSFSLRSNITQIMGKPYLIAIVDPDAFTPQNPNVSEFRHFLGADYISNGPVGTFPLTNMSKTATLTDYVGPTPPTGSDPHRYVVLCYLQNSTGVTPPSSFNASDRLSFNITTFVNTVPNNNFTLLAATFFHVSANDTTGSVVANASSSTGSAPSASGTAPAGASGSAAAGSTGDGITFQLGSVVAWSIIGALTSIGALLL